MLNIMTFFATSTDANNFIIKCSFLRSLSCQAEKKRFYLIVTQKFVWILNDWQWISVTYLNDVVQTKKIFFSFRSKRTHRAIFIFFFSWTLNSKINKANEWQYHVSHGVGTNDIHFKRNGIEKNLFFAFFKATVFHLIFFASMKLSCEWIKCKLWMQSKKWAKLTHLTRSKCRWQRRKRRLTSIYCRRFFFRTIQMTL